MTTNLLINQEVYVVHYSNFSRNRYQKGRVVKITPTGQVSVLTAHSSEPYRFKSGAQAASEIGGGYRGAHLRLDVEAVEKELELNNAQDRTNKTVATILEKLNGSRRFGSSYNVTSELKQELTALVASL